MGLSDTSGEKTDEFEDIMKNVWLGIQREKTFKKKTTDYETI